ncbi:hypothetical protein AAMO2058_000829000 [Amorphochlora amoebiformis]
MTKKHAAPASHNPSSFMPGLQYFDSKDSKAKRRATEQKGERTRNLKVQRKRQKKLAEAMDDFSNDCFDDLLNILEGTHSSWIPKTSVCRRLDPEMQTTD